MGYDTFVTKGENIMTARTVTTVFAAVAVSMTLVFATYVVVESLIDEPELSILWPSISHLHIG